MTSPFHTAAPGFRTPQITGTGLDRDVVESHSTRWLAWFLVAMLTALLTAVSTFQSLRRYEEFRSGWSWDLAYYNQWFWALTHGIPEITVNPIAPYAVEGPSIWKTNYLAPIRLRAGADLLALPGSAHFAGDPKRPVLVGRSRGLHVGAPPNLARRPWRSRLSCSCR